MLWLSWKCLLAVYFTAQVTYQFPDWLINTVGVSTNQGTSNATFVDAFQFGDPQFTLSTGLQTTDGAVFVMSSTHASNPFINNIRLFTKKGDLSMIYSTNYYGAAFAFVKSEGPANYLITCSVKAPTTPRHLVIQGLSASGNTFTANGAPKVITTMKLERIIDRPGSIWFWAARNGTAIRFSVLDGSYAQSSNLVVDGATIFLMIDLPMTNMLLAWFNGTAGNVMGSIDRGNLGIIQTQNMLTDSITNAVLDKSSENFIWDIKVLPSYKNVIEKRVIAPASGSVMTVLATGGFMFDFYYGDLSQVGTFGFMVVYPYHSNYYSASLTAGYIYFVRKTDFTVTPCQSSDQFLWYFQMIGNQLLNDPLEDSGKRFYMGFTDGTSQNFWSGYMLIDTCMNPDDNTLSCTTCPNGYWRLGFSFAGTRRCLAPQSFPALSGMRNDTNTCEPCSVANCVNCLTDHMSCSMCDASTGYYLNHLVNPPKCQKKSDFPEGRGWDDTNNLLVDCRDQHCQNCSLDYRVCLECKSSQGWFRQSDICLDESSMMLMQGADLGTGQVADCLSQGCIDCKVDHTKCVRCDSKSGWYLDNATTECISVASIPPLLGADKASLMIRACADPNCLDCRMDWKICTKCKVPEDRLEKGVCRAASDLESEEPSSNKDQNIDYSAGLGMGLTRYFSANSTAVIHFSAPLLLLYQGSFTDAFSLTLTDLLADRTHSCQDPLSSTAPLRCSVAVHGSVLTVHLATDLRVLVGTLRLQPNPSADAAIVHRLSGTPFNRYPLTVDGVSTATDPYLFWAAQPLLYSQQARPVTNLLFAGLSVSLSVLLDKQLANLEYLGVLEGPVLVYPQQIFDVVRSSSLFWPTELWGAPDWLTEATRVSRCRPTAALERQGYQCGVLGNLGVDLFVGSVAVGVCLAVSVAANKVIDRRVERVGAERESEEEGELLVSGVRGTSLTSGTSTAGGASAVGGASTATDLGGTAESSPKPQLQPAKLTVRSNMTRSSGSRVTLVTAHHPDPLTSQLRCLPTGAVPTHLASHPGIRRTAWLRDSYGVTLLFARAEANMLKLLVFVALNYWNATAGSFEQYSLIAAIIFTLYYIFQGYFTYQFASYIWREATRQSLLQSVGPTNSGLSAHSQRTSDSWSHPTAKSRTALSGAAVEAMSGPNRDVRSVLFENLGRATGMRHVLGPVIWQGRCVLLAVIAVSTAKGALAQVILALIVEIAYLVFIIKSSNPESAIDRFSELFGQSLLCAFLTMKLVVLGFQMSEKLKQTLVGYLMAWMLVLYAAIWIICICYKTAKRLLARVRPKKVTKIIHLAKPSRTLLTNTQEPAVPNSPQDPNTPSPEVQSSKLATFSNLKAYSQPPAITVKQIGSKVVHKSVVQPKRNTRWAAAKKEEGLA